MMLDLPKDTPAARAEALSILATEAASALAAGLPLLFVATSEVSGLLSALLNSPNRPSTASSIVHALLPYLSESLDVLLLFSPSNEDTPCQLLCDILQCTEQALRTPASATAISISKLLTGLLFTYQKRLLASLFDPSSDAVRQLIIYSKQLLHSGASVLSLLRQDPLYAEHWFVQQASLRLRNSVLGSLLPHLLVGLSLFVAPVGAVDAIVALLPQLLEFLFTLDEHVQHASDASLFDRAFFESGPGSVPMLIDLEATAAWTAGMFAAALVAAPPPMYFFGRFHAFALFFDAKSFQ